MEVQPIRLSYSSLNTMAGCPRKFEFQKILPNTGDRESGYAAEVGKALHEGFGDYLINHDEDSAIWKFVNHFPYEMEMMQTNDNRSFEACLSTLQAMIESTDTSEFELAKIKRPDGQIVPAIEVPFEIRLEGMTLPFREFDPVTGHRTGRIIERPIGIIGYIDAIMYSNFAMMYKSLDIKSTRESFIDATAKYKYSSQQIPYGMVISQVAGQEISEFEVDYLEAYIDLMNPKITSYRFVKTSEDIQEWCVNKILQISQLRQFMEMDYFPRTESSCMAYRYPCRFLDACASRDADAIADYLLMGNEPVMQNEEFEPWITVTIQTGSN